MRRSGFTMVELTAVISMVAVLVALLVYGVGRAAFVKHENALRVGCAMNLKQIAIAFEMYAQEDKGQSYPTMKYAGGEDCSELVAGNFFFQPDQLIPQYLKDASFAVCPSDSDAVKRLAEISKCGGDGQQLCPCRLDGHSYCYTGLLITEDHYIKSGADPSAPGGAELHQPFMDAMTGLIARQAAATNKAEAMAVVDSDIKLQSSASCDLLRLRKGVARLRTNNQSGAFFLVDHAASLPVMWDVYDVQPDLFPHNPTGCNVLYFDGHVEYWRYPSPEHPVNATWPHIMQTLGR